MANKVFEFSQHLGPRLTFCRVQFVPSLRLLRGSAALLPDVPGVNAFHLKNPKNFLGGRQQRKILIFVACELLNIGIDYEHQGGQNAGSAASSWASSFAAFSSSTASSTSQRCTADQNWSELDTFGVCSWMPRSGNEMDSSLILEKCLKIEIFSKSKMSQSWLQMPDVLIKARLVAMRQANTNFTHEPRVWLEHVGILHDITVSGNKMHLLREVTMKMLHRNLKKPPLQSHRQRP